MITDTRAGAEVQEKRQGQRYRRRSQGRVSSGRKSVASNAVKVEEDEDSSTSIRSSNEAVASTARVRSVE